MRKNVLSLVLSASLVCGLMPMGQWGQKASAAGGDSSGGIEVSADKAGVSKQSDEAGGVTASGTFGGEKDSEGETLTEDTHQWSFAAGTGVLTISGEGAMPNYDCRKQFYASGFFSINMLTMAIGRLFLINIIYTFVGNN